MSNNEKKIYQALKIGICGLAHIKNPVYGCKKDPAFTTDK